MRLDREDDDWNDEAVTERDLTSARGMRVLIGDDDESLRELLALRLSSEGYEVFEADTGAEVLRILDSMDVDSFPAERVDLILLDLRMPGLNGLDVLRFLSARRTQIPIILMTAFPDASTRADAAKLGARLLAKPFSLDAVSRSALDAILAQASR